MTDDEIIAGLKAQRDQAFAELRAARREHPTPARLPAPLAQLLRGALAAPTNRSDRLLILADTARCHRSVGGPPYPTEAWEALATLAEALAPAFADDAVTVPPGPIPPPLPDIHPNTLRGTALNWRSTAPKMAAWLDACADALEAHAEAIRHG